MPERAGLNVYSIAAHRGFADALVAGLIPRYADADLGLARLTVLLPSQRAARTLTEAFVRQSGGGLLLPRMAVVGDLDLDETLGALLDPLGTGADIAPASDPLHRWLRLAEHLRTVEGEGKPISAGLLRRAWELGRTMDRLLVEGMAPDDLLSDRIVGIVGDLSDHWQKGTTDFLKVQARWLSELTQRGECDAPARRNRLFELAARRWQEQPPPHPIVAAGVTSASPALARLLRVVAGLPASAVVLPDLDLTLDKDVWEALGTAGAPEGPDDPPFGRDDAVTHPQFHLKLLLNRMGINRGEVRSWHRAGAAAAPPARSRAISNIFLPPAASARWVDLPPKERRLDGVRLMQTAHPGEEAQAIAILIREALEVPERRVALITPDRALAGRVVAHLDRWGIAANDSAGLPLPQTAAGRVPLLLAQVLAESAAPVPLVALLTHPLVHPGDGRADWLDGARKLDLALRGPRPDAGLLPLRALSEKLGFADWWEGAEAALCPLFDVAEEELLADLLDRIAGVAEALCGTALWGGADGRSAAKLLDDLRSVARDAGTRIDPRELHAVLADAMERIAVRPPWGGHSRVAIYGLIEARMSRADLIVCGGLVEGVWPASPTPDALLPPPVLRALGVPGADFRIGLSAHDLAGALGAPEVVLSWADRDAGAPVIPSRFVLRVQAMLGDQICVHRETEVVRLARAIDRTKQCAPHPRPQPRPNAEQRRVTLSATGLDRLRSDPYQFYANAILRLKKRDSLDAAPSAAWRGEAVHAILEAWHKAGGKAGELIGIASAVLDGMSAHPLTRSLWRPRLLAALGWIDERVAALAGDGRHVALSEDWGSIEVKGVRVVAKADRIDRMPGGKLAIVDYKTGGAPSARMVAEGYALQLGTVGLIAREGGFKDLRGEPDAFEYWSLARDAARRDEGGFGLVTTPILESKKRTGVLREDFLPMAEAFLTEAIDDWILGTVPFTARMNPDVAAYTDYDQLMRLDEWITSLGDKP